MGQRNVPSDFAGFVIANQIDRRIQRVVFGRDIAEINVRQVIVGEKLAGNRRLVVEVKRDLRLARIGVEVVEEFFDPQRELCCTPQNMWRYRL